MNQKKISKLAVIFTGGTISMTHAGSGGAVPTLSGEDICRWVPELSHFDIDVIDFGRLPGPHMGFERMAELSRVVVGALARGAEGVVITHGTDTLEETAYFLDLVHDDPRPVVIAGAMRTSDELSWDGPINLFSAALVAADPASRNRGVLVVMNNTINAASEVTKTFTEALDTFVSPNAGSMGVIDLQRVFYYRTSVRRRALSQNGIFPRVEVLEATAGNDGALVDAAVALGCEGLVIAAMGRGNVPPLMAEALVRAMHAGLQVVVCSRCWGGRVAPVYAYPGGGARLLEAGALFAPWLNPQKARVALCLALGSKMQGEALKQLFE